MPISQTPDNGADSTVQIVPTPQATGPAPSAVQLASQRAREAIATAGTAVATPPAAETPAPSAGHGAPAPVPPAPAAGQPAPVPTPASGQQTPPATETPEEKAAREAAAAAAPATETDEERQAREASEALVVEIPIGETEDDHLVLTLDNAEHAEEVRRLVDMAIEGQEALEIVEQVRQTAAQHEELREYADADPIGFTLDMIGTDLERAKALTLFLLTQPSLYNAIKDDIAKLSDATQFRLVAADARETRHTMAEQANERIETSRVVRQNLQEIQNTVEAMLPQDLSPAQRQVAYRDCLRDLKEYADSKDLLVLPVHEIPTVLRHRLTALGLDPEAAAARAVVATARNGGPTSTPRLPRAAAPVTRTPPARPVAPAAKKDGAAFVASAARRRDAAAIPGAGAGSPTNGGGVQAPRDKDGKPLGIKDTLAWHRAQRAKGVRLW